jgi:hypothetical protein
MLAKSRIAYLQAQLNATLIEEPRLHKALVHGCALNEDGRAYLRVLVHEAVHCLKPLLLTLPDGLHGFESVISAHGAPAVSAQPLGDILLAAREGLTMFKPLC